MEIVACPKCGSRKIFQGRMGDGVITGYNTRNVCRNCGYQGMPIIFDSEKDYKNFLKGLDEKPSDLKKADREPQKSKSDKVHKRPLGINILVLFLIVQALAAIYIYYDIIGFENATFLWIYYFSVLVLSAIILPYGLLAGKSWGWALAGFMFAISIPIGLVFLYYITRPHVKAFYGKN